LYQPSRVRNRHRKNWPRLRVYLIEAPTREIDRHGARPLALDTAHTKAVPSVEDQRLPDTPQQNRRDDNDVQRRPVDACGAIGAEVGTHRKLVCKAECAGEIRVEVNRLPRLASEASAGGSYRGRCDRDQQREGDERHEDVRVVTDEIRTSARPATCDWPRRSRRL
jgi:hypothetical protein